MRKVLPFLNTSTYYKNESAIQTKCVPTTQDKHYTKMASFVLPSIFMEKFFGRLHMRDMD